MTVVSSHEITAMSPAGTGTVDVTVTTPSGYQRHQRVGPVHLRVSRKFRPPTVNDISCARCGQEMSFFHEGKNATSLVARHRTSVSIGNRSGLSNDSEHEEVRRGMTAVPTVSVCMPVSREARFVRRALGSVLSQDFSNFEVLIGDETGAAERAVVEIDDHRVRYHRNPHGLGFTKNHVTLLNRVVGSYVAVLHDDDWWEPSYLSSLIAVLDSDPEVGLACCATVLDHGDGVTSPWPFPLSAGRHDDVVNVLLREDWFLLPISTIWRKELWTGPAREWPELSCADLQFSCPPPRRAGRCTTSPTR